MNFRQCRKRRIICRRRFVVANTAAIVLLLECMLVSSLLSMKFFCNGHKNPYVVVGLFFLLLEIAKIIHYDDKIQISCPSAGNNIRSEPNRGLGNTTNVQRQSTAFEKNLSIVAMCRLLYPIAYDDGQQKEKQLLVFEKSR